MRIPILLALLAAAQPAWAGQKATYVDDEGKTILVQVTDSGDARIAPSTPDQYGLLRDGQFYLVSKEEGKWKVARIEDVAAALDQVLPPIFKTLFGAAAKAKPTTMRMEAKGSRTVAGFTGKVYVIHTSDEKKGDPPAEVVLSEDPSLQPVGRAIGGFLTSTMLLMAPFLGDAAADMIKDTQTVLSRGAPLDIRGKFRLTSVTAADVPASTVDLPAKPQSVSEIVAALKVSSVPGISATSSPPEAAN